MQNAFALPRYLVELSLERIWGTFGQYPFIAWPALAALYSLVLLMVRKWFDNLDYDTFVFAAIITVIVIFVSVCTYTLFTHPGFQMR
jgi:hypothetical protein